MSQHQQGIGSDRRVHHRFEDLRASLVGLGENNSGIVLNISEGGMAILSTEDLDLNSLRNLRFQAPEFEHWMEINAEVAWISDSRKQAGIRFKGLSEKARIQLRAGISIATVRAKRAAQAKQNGGAATKSAQSVQEVTDSTPESVVDSSPESFAASVTTDSATPVASESEHFPAEVNANSTVPEPLQETEQLEASLPPADPMPQAFATPPTTDSAIPITSEPEKVPIEANATPSVQEPPQESEQFGASLPQADPIPQSFATPPTTDSAMPITSEPEHFPIEANANSPVQEAVQETHQHERALQSADSIRKSIATPAITDSAMPITSEPEHSPAEANANSPVQEAAQETHQHERALQSADSIPQSFATPATTDPAMPITSEPEHFPAEANANLPVPEPVQHTEQLESSLQPNATEAIPNSRLPEAPQEAKPEEKKILPEESKQGERTSPLNSTDTKPQNTSALIANAARSSALTLQKSPLAEMPSRSLLPDRAVKHSSDAYKAITDRTDNSYRKWIAVGAIAILASLLAFLAGWILGDPARMKLGH